MGESVANGSGKHSVLPAQSNRISSRQMYKKSGQGPNKATAEGKKSIECHGEKERMGE